MPRDKDFKRLIRARMQKTGESYTTARARFLDKSKRRSTAPADEPRDLAAIAGQSDAKVVEKTGRSWQEWVDLLDARQAFQLPHSGIAKLVGGEPGVGPWWAQTVTVGYERIRGLRERGQRRDGYYEAGRSRTYPVPVDTLFRAWAEPDQRKRWLTGARPRRRTATSPKTLRLDWSDGSRVALYFTPKGDTKSSVAVQHERLPDRDTANAMKAYWSAQLDALGTYLKG